MVQLHGHGDPLLMEVIVGLEEMLHPEFKNSTTGTRGVGERHAGIGDPLFKEAERYHQEENDHVANVAKKIALHERLVKRDKHNSLFGSTGATYDPILHEYVLPAATLSELKALEADIDNKRGLFREMSMRKRNNLNEQELYCDPLVNSYRMKALMFGRGDKKLLQDKNGVAVKSTYRKLNKGDPLYTAANKVSKPYKFIGIYLYFHGIYSHLSIHFFGEIKYTGHQPVPAVECTYRKLNAGDELLNDIMEHHNAIEQ